MPTVLRRPLLALLTCTAALAALPQVAGAQQAVLATNGSTLQPAPNLVLPGGANQCAARPYIGLNPGNITFLNTGQSTCMWWSSEYGADGSVIANTYVPRGAGAVTRVRVRSGAAPAPLQFAILGSGSGLCCTTKQISAPVQPVAGQISEFAVNLPAGSGVGDTPGSQFNDILVVVAAGPGSLPVNDRGAHGFLFGSPANQAQASFLHPALALGASNTDVGLMDGYEVLLQYDWCGVPMTGSNLRPVAPADPTTACAGQGPGTAPVGTAPTTPTPAAAAPSPLRALATLAAVRRNVAAAAAALPADDDLRRDAAAAPEDRRRRARRRRGAQDLRQRAIPHRGRSLGHVARDAVEGRAQRAEAQAARLRRGARQRGRGELDAQAHAEALTQAQRRSG